MKLFKRNKYTFLGLIITLIIVITIALAKLSPINISYLSKDIKSTISSIFLIIVLIGPIVSIVLSIIGYKKSEKKYRILNLLNFLLCVGIGLYMYKSVSDSLSQSNCGGTWCGELNTTINWDQDNK